MLHFNEIDWPKIRSYFPGLNNKTFLDAACVSLVPVQIKEAVTSFIEMTLDCQEEDASLHHIAMDNMRLVAMKEAAKLLNVDEKNICLIESTTHGLNIAANVIPLKDGDNILIADTEFLQVSIPWMQKMDSLNLEIKKVITEDGILPVSAFEKQIDHKTRAICVSSVQWCTGHRVDIERLGMLCKEKGIWLIVDGIHEFGVVNVDLTEKYVDFYIAGGHKWLNSPYGCGVMYLSDRVLNELEPNSFGYLATEEPPGGWGEYFRTPSITPYHKFSFQRNAKRFEIAGTANYPGAVALGASLKLVNDIGIQSIERRVKELTDFLHQELQSLGVTLVTKSNPELRSGITIFSYYNDPVKDRALLDQLLANKVYLSIRYTSNIGGIRVSTHYFNNEDDILTLIELVKNHVKQ